MHDLHHLFLIDNFEGLFDVGFHQSKELLEPFFEIGFSFSVVLHIPVVHIVNEVVHSFDHSLPDIMLGVSIDWIELTFNSIQKVLFILGIDFLFLTEIDASDPLVLNFLERWFCLDKFI